MSTPEQERDPYWQEDVAIGEAALFRGETYAVRMRLHTTTERYAGRRELVPLSHPVGERVYVHAKPYILVPDVTQTSPRHPGRIWAVSAVTAGGCNRPPAPRSGHRTGRGPNLAGPTHSRWARRQGRCFVTGSSGHMCEPCVGEVSTGATNVETVSGSGAPDSPRRTAPPRVHERPFPLAHAARSALSIRYWACDLEYSLGCGLGT